MMANSGQDENEKLLWVVERTALILSEAGIPRMPARVLAYMLADDADHYTAAALADGIRVSPAAISGAVRHLTAQRMLVKVREPGKRAELYRICDGDLCGMIVGARIPVLKEWESALEAAIAETGADRAGRGGRRRLAEATAFIAFLRSETEEMLGRWAEYRRDLRWPRPEVLAHSRFDRAGSPRGGLARRTRACPSGLGQ